MTNFANGYALIIGIANYSKINALPTTVLNDARDLADLLISPAHCGYLETHVTLLLNEQATAIEIRQELQRLASVAGPNTTVLLFFSGHGGRVANGANVGSYLIPYDCDPENLVGTALSNQEITTLLHNIQAVRLLVFFDCCYAAGAGEAKNIRLEQIGFKGGLEESYYEQLAQGSGRVIIASSRINEVSLVLPSMNNSLFTHYLLDALSGSADTHGDGLIRVFEIFDYVSKMTPTRGKQHPIFKAADLENNFPVALFLGGKSSNSAAGGSDIRPRPVSNKLLRELVSTVFIDDELSDFCFDYFPKVYEQFAAGQTKSMRVRMLAEYVQRQDLVDELFVEIRKLNPNVYDKFMHQMK